MAHTEPHEKKGVATVESAGVDELIGRLRDQGIAEGREKAEALVAAAQQRASEIVAAAKRDADAVLAEAKEQAGKQKAAGEDAIRLAMRDTILSVEGDMLKGFADRLRHLVKGVLADPSFLQQVILGVAGEAGRVAAGKTAEIQLPAQLVSLEDLRKKPEEAAPGSLMHFVLSMGGGLLREGVSFGASEDGEGGIRVRLADEDLQIDLTDGAVTELLLRHMVPRFRALLRGFVAADSIDLSFFIAFPLLWSLGPETFTRPGRPSARRKDSEGVQAGSSCTADIETSLQSERRSNLNVRCFAGQRRAWLAGLRNEERRP